MNLKVGQKTDEPLLSRTKVEASVTFDAETPSTSEISAAIAKNVSKDIGLVDIEKIETAYGKQTATVVAYAYENSEMIDHARKLGKKKLEAMKKAEEDAKKAAEEKKKAQEEAKEKAAEEKEAAADDKKEDAPKAEEKPEEKKE